MSALSTVKRIASLKGLGVFHDVGAPADLPDFQQHCLLYGFNGSGKTTLSRVFRSLEAGVLQPELPAGGRFTIELTDGQTIREDSNLDLLKDRILIFNVDFVAKNLRWNEGTADPVFYIGKAQAELSKKLEQTETAVREVSTKLAQADSSRQKAERALSEHKRDAARTIAEAVNLGRRYAAPNLTADYEGQSYGREYLVPDEERKQLRNVINQDAPLPKLNMIAPPSLRLAQLITKARMLLGTTLGTITIEDLKKHDTMLNWVRHGFEYHSKQGLSSCLFCGNQFTAARLAALKGIVDNQFDKLTKDVSETMAEAEALRRNLAGLKEGAPSRNDVAKDLQNEFSSASDALRRLVDTGGAVAAAALALLRSKAESPNAKIQEKGLPDDAQALKWQKEIGVAMNAYSEVIATHNRSHDEFAQIQAAASTRLKKHFLAEGQEAYRQNEKSLSSVQIIIDGLNRDLGGLLSEAETLKRQVRQHGPAAEVINKLVSCYLGHDQLAIQPLNEGYQINRKGTRIEGSLSEGEKTAIALCYFLSMLDAENRRLKDLIVVVDDPVSSLDTRALNYAFNLIKSSLSGVAQLIIFTHNLPFMNEVKKWLKKSASKEKPTATMLFLDSSVDPKTKSRSTKITPLPKLIRDYDFEYQYMFFLTRQFSAGGGGDDGYFYLMPNVLRKVLEIFLAFKLPGPDGLGSKVDAIANGKHGIDPQRIRAIDRLVQTESHADSLDDLVAFSSMTIEETRDAAEGILAVMQTLDKGHYDRICSLCT